MREVLMTSCHLSLHQWTTTPAPPHITWTKVQLVHTAVTHTDRPSSDAVLLCVQWWRCTATRPPNPTTCRSPRVMSSTWRIAMTTAGARACSTATEASSLKTTSNHVARLWPRPLCVSAAPQRSNTVTTCSVCRNNERNLALISADDTDFQLFLCF